MKIVVLKGSPNINGSSNLLAAEFIRGAEEAGHSTQVIDAAHADIHPCTGCIHCGYEGPCVQKDDVDQIRQIILEADMLVFVTPLYYYGMSAQLKTLVRYLNLTDMGMVFGTRCGRPAMTQQSRFPRQAYKLGRSLS